jgi:hypothetical protein
VNSGASGIFGTGAALARDPGDYRPMKTILLLCVWCAVASAEPWPVHVPDGWVEQKALADAQLGKLMQVPGTVRGEGTFFLSPDGDAQLTILRWDLKLDSSSKDTVEQFDKGMTAGASRQATRHVSDGRHFVAQQMRASSIDEVKGLQVHQERVYGVDTSGVIHLVSAICTAAPSALGPCESVQSTLMLSLANAADFGASDDKDMAYNIGYGVGGVLTVMGLIWLVRRFAS